MTAWNNVKAINMHKSLCKSAGPALNYSISQDWAPPHSILYADETTGSHVCRLKKNNKLGGIEPSSSLPVGIAQAQTANDDRLALTRLSFSSMIGILIESANLPSAFPKVFDNIQILTKTMGTLRSTSLGVLYSVSTTNLALFYPQEK